MLVLSPLQRHWSSVLATGAAAGTLAGLLVALAWRQQKHLAIDGPARTTDKKAVDPTVEARLRDALLVPVVALTDASGAAALCSALLEGGLPVMEVVFRSAGAEEALRRMAAAEPEALLGAGAILSVEQARRAVAAGARFIVSPGLNEEVVRWCQQQGIFVMPGVATPTEAEQALRLGLSVVKFFPAEAKGGVAALKALLAPYPELTFVPTGGIRDDNLESYLAIPQVACCGGTWMVPQDSIARGDWRHVKELSMRASARASLAKQRASAGARA
eukprot:TRINITY_DN91145_c0_g1_i1.p1 TRINITY_DN91145_c0_g1~~TRINITY_DN91145_c0_g1_i1.p1  ORF type:complete len:284 (+),score=66.31 TRINITY_DN91145_c0_g1_i1:32-853(+)